MDAEHLVGDAEAEVLDEAALPGPLNDGVGEPAGVSIATLYRHFPTRQALLEALHRERAAGGVPCCEGAWLAITDTAQFHRGA